MNERDKLLGLNRPVTPPARNWLIGFFALVAIVAVGVAAYLAGRSSAVPSTEVAKKPPPATIPKTPVLRPVAELPPQAKAPVAGITLSRITDGEMQKIEPGAGCSFSVGDRYYLLTNFDQALIKVGSKATVHNLSDDAGKRLFEAASRVSVGKYLIDIQRLGPEKQLYEGSTAPATLKITEGDARGEIRGTWGCGA